MADIILNSTETTGEDIRIGSTDGGWWQCEVAGYVAQVSIQLKYINSTEYIEVFGFEDNGAKTFLAAAGRVYRAKSGTAGATVWLEKIE